MLRAILSAVVISSALGAYCGWWATSDFYEAKVAASEKQALANEEKIVREQGEISKQTQNEKDDIQNRYNNLVSAYRGVHNGTNKTADSPAAVPSQGLRLLEPDVEFLIRFAQQCANTEIERNDIIQKYDKLNAD